MLLSKRKMTVRFTERSAHMVYFECDLGNAGYVIVNLALDEWHEMGEPMEIDVVLEPVYSTLEVES